MKSKSESKWNSSDITVWLGNELDWFLFETKMRSLVRDILEPVVEKSEMESERYLGLDRKANSIIKRLEVVEYSLYGGNPPPANTHPMSSAS
jgi:hypothetical protein